MTWRKHFKPAPTGTSLSPISGSNASNRPGPARTNYSNFLPDIYAGSANRIERYGQIELMDGDPECSGALDILAEFCTQKLKDNKSPFNVKWRQKATNSEITIVAEYMHQWLKLQKFDTRMFRIVRNTFKYGDSFFIRDPETQEWLWIDPAKVIKIIVNESNGKEPEQYVIKDLAPNFEHLVTTQITPNVNPRMNSGGISGGGYFTATPTQRGTSGPYPSPSTGGRFGLAETEYAVEAKHVVHLSLSEGLDNNYPFGASLLENVYKVFKQKELLEDAILIYRIHRAPERLVFKLDVGSMPPHLSMAYIERVKNDLKQRRIPSQTGGGSTIDSTYNPLCLDLTTKIPLLDGRVLELQEIINEFNEGKENWAYSCNPETGEIVPGNISWAGVTRKNAEVIKLTFDNDKTLICTPDHRIPVFSKGFIEAKDITNDDNLISFNTNQNSVWDHKHKGWLDSNDIVDNFFNKKEPVKENNHLDINVAHYKMVKIEVVDSRDTGTLTIDGNEVWHNYHTFAIESGIFVKNSINDNFFFPVSHDGKGSSVDVLPGGCFSMDTKVSLLDGRELSITEISNELSEGKQLWAHSCEPITGKVVPGLISWAGVTRKDAKVMKITLDSGDEIICTPDHKFVQHDVEYRRACELKEGNSLMPLYRQHNSMVKNGALYEQVFDNEDKTWKFTHQLVANYLRDTIVKYEVFNERVSNGLYEVRHHKDFDRLNNDPNNLCFMSRKDHFMYHCENNDYRMDYLKQNNPLLYNEICNNMSISTKKWIANLSEEDREQRDEMCREKFRYASKIKLEKMANDPEFRQWVCDRQRDGWTDELRQQRSKETSIRQKILWRDEAKRKAFSDHQTVTYSHNMLLKAIDLIKGKTSHQFTGKDVITALNADEEIIAELRELNKNKNVRNWSIDRGFTLTGLKNMAKQFGYKDWTDLRIKESVHNHRIAKIEYLNTPMDVGTLTIDQDEIHHNYHTFALSAGVFVFNSSIGEIGDLQYFTNKLFRGLKIPSSYLPTGAEDSQAAFNDGRVGTAYIQELRFNKYCERLQSLLVEVFDTEFKMYMYARGMNIDPSLFELQFNPPMNFASARQSELDNQRINTFTTIQGIPYVSKRFAMKRFLGLTDEEVAENERLWAEEQGSSEPTHTDAAGELRSAGLSAGGIEGDLGMAGDLNAPEDLAQDITGEELPPTGAAPAPSTPTSSPTAM